MTNSAQVLQLRVRLGFGPLWTETSLSFTFSSDSSAGEQNFLELPGTSRRLRCLLTFSSADRTIRTS